MADAERYRDDADLVMELAAAASVGELRQLPDGRVGWMQGSGAGAAGNDRVFKTVGAVAIAKTVGIAFLDGGKVYWDRSARKGHYKQVDDQDCYAGTCVGDAASADATMIVNLNVEQRRKVCLRRDPFTSNIVGTQALGGLGIQPRGGAWNFKLDATNEAQKLDALAKDGFGIAANAIIEGAFNVLSDGSGAGTDVNLGVANSSHATDADSITRRLFLHLDGNSADISVQSSDGTTTVGIIDTTVDYVEGPGNANRVEFWIDLREPADAKVYLNGVRVLASTVFPLTMASTLYLLVHVEKTSSTDTYEIDVEEFYVRTQE